jgi:3-hydroxyacyl-[acyl-carrier-protein] dehydratase
MKMPHATFEGAIRVGQEKAVIAEDITLTFAYVESTVAPASAEAASQAGDASANPPLRVAMNA